MCSVVAGGRLQLGGQWWFFQSVQKQHRVIDKVSLLATKQSSLERALYTHTFYSLTSLTPHYPIPFCRYVFKKYAQLFAYSAFGERCCVLCGIISISWAAI